MEGQKDFREFLALLNAHKVNFVQRISQTLKPWKRKRNNQHYPNSGPDPEIPSWDCNGGRSRKPLCRDR